MKFNESGPYDSGIEAEIMRLLDDLEMRLKALARRRARLARRAGRRPPQPEG